MNSLVGKWYPSTKLMIVLTAILVSMFATENSYQWVIFVFTILLCILSGVIVDFIKVFLKSIFLIVIFIFLVQVFIVSNPDSQIIWLFIKFSNVGLQNSIQLSSRIVAISSIIIWFFLVTSVKDIVYAMEKAHFSKKLTFVISSTIQLIPQMSKLSQTITDAQKARGVESDGNLWVRMKAFIPMIGPLILTSIQQTDERVLTLEARGFSSSKSKTSYYIIRKTMVDYVICIGCVVLLVLFFGGLL